jgi:hypothetical protein
MVTSDLSGGKMKRLLFPLLLMSLPCVAWSAPKYQASGVPAATDPGRTADSTSNDLGAASTEMLSVIRALSGRWSMEVTFEPSPDAPKGAQGKGEESWHAGAQGLTLIDEEHILVPPLDIHLLGMLWWDSAEKKFHGMECVNQNPHACDPKGALNDVTITWDGKQLTIDEIQTSPTGKRSQWHETYSNITPTSFLQVGESGEVGSPLKKVVTLHGTRMDQ